MKQEIIDKSLAFIKTKPKPLPCPVTWDFKPAPGLAFATHKFSVLDAIESASYFVHEKTRVTKPDVERTFYWVALGSGMVSVVATLPHFIARSDADAAYRPLHNVHYLGEVCNKGLFADYEAHPAAILVGNEYLCAAVEVVNFRKFTD